jgi:hypothetical protein
MHFFYRPAIRKRIAGCLLLLTISELAFPSVSYALTSGPSQPEFSSFEPVSTNQLVDEFSGDFTYNIPVISIPGPNGSDYPLSLSYHSGATSEEEASWVGYGWTLNPGAITRNTRGFPDDYNQSTVAYYNKMPTNWTATAGVGAAGLEVFGKDMPVNLSYALRYNNYQGFGFNRNVGISLGKGVISLGYSDTDGGGSFSASVRPVTLLNRAHDVLGALHKPKETSQVQAGENATANKEHKRFSASPITLLGGNHGFFTYSDYNRSTHATSYSGGSMNVSVGLQVNAPPVPAGLTVNVFGSYSWQTNTEQEDLKAYGYLYSAEADNANDDIKDSGIRDYYTEKETSYNKRDNFLGMPFNNADIFAVSGEGVGGSFRLYHDKVGEFVPNYKASKIIIGNLSPEISVGTTFGLGADFGGGWQEFSEGPWEREKAYRTSFSTAATGTDNVFFRFANDLGGGTSPAVISDEPVTAQEGRTHPGKTGLQNELGQTATHSRASFIAYHTIKDVVKSYGTPPQMRKARRFSQREDLPTNYNALDQSAICEMAISTSAGGRYLYGLPVLSAGENNLQYNIEQKDNIKQNYIAQIAPGASLDSRTTKLGETRNTPYASSFPLTEIQTSDYVDRTLDGPTPDDFGGYTRFNYDKVYDIGKFPDNAYHWRTPYNGLLFRANSLSDPEDDLGSVSYGRKDVVYLSSVQTKTHTAIFVRSPRDDARDALSEDNDIPSRRGGTEDPKTGSGYKSMDKLSRIDLYNNSDLDANGKPMTGKFPIKSVHFSYSYELFKAKDAKGIPNALIDSDTGKRKGKLTLTRIWFEYQGIPTKVSPYTFSYNYPSYSSYPAKYMPAGGQSVTTSAEDLASKHEVGYYDKLSADAQNPAYDPLNLDAWGNYCANGPARAQNMQPWLDQRDLWDNGGATASPSWDPAAWQLKVITLPTGGQIHVQYEQDDYAYVQNKPVHAMASLLPTGKGDNIFQLNAEELGLTEDSEKQATADALNKQYKGTGRKIFFKFLYSLVGSITPTLQPLTTNAEYITGYTTIRDARFVSGNPSSGNPSTIELELDASATGYTLPKQVCQNFLLTQRAGKLGGNKFTANKATPMQAVRDLVAWYMVNNKFGNQCGSLNPALSYFRIPLVKPKKGGGLRVKRLLTFDQTGLDGTPVLYGSEYSYRMRTNDGKIISSGVATTEPGAMREENILVDYLPREGQSLFSRAVSGLDRKQAEGPLGESLLPGPSVGYSRVVVRNIHSGRTTPGFSISEFFTARDYPMQVKYTSLKPDNQFRLIPLLLFTDQVNNTYATQGYSFLLNNMHGQVRRRATYPGNYPGHEVLSANLPSPTTEQKYDYYQPARLPDADAAIQPGDYLPVVGEQSSPTQQQLNPTQPLYPGREVDITSAQKAVKDNMVDINFETDTDVAIFFWPMFYATVFPCITRSQSELYTHVTTKVIRYPAVIRRIETTQDGIKHITENIAFDQLSGQPVQTRETDEFKGGYVHETTQAAWVRPELGAKWDRESLLLPAATGTVQLTSGSDGATWLKFSGSACDGLAKLTRGDQLRIVLPSDADEGNNMLYFADAPDFLNKQVRVYPVKLPFVATASAVPPATGAVTAVQVLTSGRRNQLSAPAASTVYHGTDYTTLSSVGPFTTTTKYAPSAFSRDIASWLGTSTSTTASFSSGAGSYDHINLSAYVNKLPVGCVKDPSDVTISNVVLKKQTLNGKVTVSLVSCAVSCENGGSAFTLQN